MTQTLYRGTQRPEIEGVRKGLSYTPSLPAAVIWSSMPPDAWGRREPAFLPTSTIHEAQIVRGGKVLQLAEDSYVSFQRILLLFGYGRRNGISKDEAIKILLYMHNRVIGKARGGEFLYKLVDEDGEERDDRHLPLSFSSPMTLISEFKDEFEGDDTITGRLAADVFIFSDAPAVQREAVRQGYDILSYRDVFQGAEGASEKLLGIPAEDLHGVETEYDLNRDRVCVHETYRPLTAGAIKVVGSILTKDLLKRVDPAEFSQVP